MREPLNPATKAQLQFATDDNYWQTAYANAQAQVALLQHANIATGSEKIEYTLSV